MTYVTPTAYFAHQASLPAVTAEQLYHDNKAFLQTMVQQDAIVHLFSKQYNKSGQHSPALNNTNIATDIMLVVAKTILETDEAWVSAKAVQDRPLPAYENPKILNNAFGENGNTAEGQLKMLAMSGLLVTRKENGFSKYAFSSDAVDMFKNYVTVNKLETVRPN